MKVIDEKDGKDVVVGYQRNKDRKSFKYKKPYDKKTKEYINEF